MKQKTGAPRRGDVVWIDMSPQAGHEQAGRRPAVVLSPDGYNDKTGLALVCPVTSRAKGYPFEVQLPKGMVVSGVVLVDQLRSVDWHARRADRAGSLPHGIIIDILAKLDTLLPRQ